MAKSENALRVDDKQMIVTLDVSWDETDLASFIVQLRERMSEMKLTPIPSPEELEKILRGPYKAKRNIKGLEIMRGTAPTKPVQPDIEWARDFFTESYVVDEDGKINYRRRVGNPNVQKGEVLARVSVPKQGEPGLNVMGKTIRPDAIKPVRIRAAQRVSEQTEDGQRVFYAESAGRVRWSENKLSIDDVMEISRSVGLSTGDIQHPGAVVINGDVLTGAHVEADGDIEIHGSVDPATIIAGGSLVIHGGITGSPEHKITAAGKVVAKFINEAHVEAEGNVEVENEILQSFIRTRGELLIPTGRLVGGKTLTLGGATVGQLGSDSNIRTTIIAGYEEEERNPVFQCNAKLERHQEVHKKIRSTLRPLHIRQQSLTPRELKMYQELEKKSELLETKIANLSEELEDIRIAYDHRVNGKILVKEKLFPETAIQLINIRKLNHQAFDCQVHISIQHGEIDFRPSKREE